MAGYIDQIEVGSANDPRIINVTTDQEASFNGAEVQAVQGSTTIKSTISNYKATLEVPKDGEWTVSAPSVSGAGKGSITFNGKGDVKLSKTCTATLKVIATNNYKDMSNGTLIISLYEYGNYGSFLKQTGTTNGPTKVDKGYQAIMNYSFSEFKKYTLNVTLTDNSSTTKNNINVKEFDVDTNKEYLFEFNITTVRDPGIDPPEIFDDYPLSEPTEPTLEYLQSLGKSEEEAQETLSAWQAERQRYLSYEEEGLEEDQILTAMYPDVVEAEVIDETV